MRLRPAVYWSALPQNVSFRDRFKLALDAGFEGVEGRTVTDEREIGAIAEAAAATGIVIPTVVNWASWNCELYSDDPGEVDSAVASLLTTLKNAHTWGASAIHFIPGFVKNGISYPEAYRRIQQVIRERILPVAEAYSIVCGVENAWYSIVQGPLEYIRFIDEFKSPFIKAFLDTGNMIFGHTEDWIRLAGSRVVRLHIKDFCLDRSGRIAWRPHYTCSFERIGEGAVNWEAVSAALTDIGYEGWGTCGEVSPTLPARLLNKACEKLSGHHVDRLPGVGRMMTRLQTSVALGSLRDATGRLDRFLR